MKNPQFRMLAWPEVMTVALCCLVSAGASALPPRIEVDARMRTADSAIVDETIVPGAVLRSGDELRFRVTAWADGHLYVIALGSSGTAVLLHPFESGPADPAQRGVLPAPVGGGEAVSVPADGGYLALDERTGQEMIVAFVADEPVASLPRLMFRMEGLFNEPVAAREVLVSEGFEPAHISFVHASRAVASASTSVEHSLASAPIAPATPVPGAVTSRAGAGNFSSASVPSKVQHEGVLGGLGSRIAQFTGQPAGQGHESAPTISATLPPIDIEQRRADEPNVTPSPKGGSLFSRWFGSDDKDEGNSPVAVAVEPELPKVQKARTFALPRERPATRQLMPPRTLARATANDPLPDPRAGDSAQNTQAVLFTGESAGKQDTVESVVASSAPQRVRSSATATSPNTVLAAIPVIAESATHEKAESARGAASESVVKAGDASLQTQQATQAWNPLAEGSTSLHDRQLATPPAEVVISRSTDSVEHSGAWFSGLGTLFSGGPPDESSADASRTDAKKLAASDPVVTQGSSVSGQDTTLVVQPAETLRADTQGSDEGVPVENGARIDVTVAQDAARSDASRYESTEQASSEGGLLAGLGALLTNPFKSVDDEAPSTPAVQAQETGQSSPQSANTANTGNEPGIKRRMARDGKEVVVSGGLPVARPQKKQNQEVLGESGSRIRRLLDEPEPRSVAASANEIDMSASVARTLAARDTVAATPPPPAVPASVASVQADPVQSALANEGDRFVSPSSQQIALRSAAPAKAVSRAVTALASVDVNSDSGVASSVVLVITPSGSTSGVLIDRDGHLLTNWHSVNKFDEVVVMFKQSQGAKPRRNDPVRARVVAHSKFADLALLKAEIVPAGLVPAVVATDVNMQSGSPIHAISYAAGRGGDGQWQHHIATVDRVRRSSSWYSAQRVLHRADVIRAEMDPVRDVTGAPLFNNQLELIGLGAMVRVDKGEIIGVSAATIRAFLDGSS